MWKQYGKDVETICEGCGNNMNWKQYDQNFHEPRETVTNFFLDPSTDPCVIKLRQLHGEVPVLVPLFQKVSIVMAIEQSPKETHNFIFNKILVLDNQTSNFETTDII